MKLYTYSLLIAFALLASVSCARSPRCAVEPGQYSSRLSAAFSASEETSNLFVEASPKSVVITFSVDPAVGIESMPESCSGTTLRGRFEDNWGNTGLYVLALGDRPTLEFFELGTPDEMAGRNTIGAYPENAVALEMAK